MENLTRRQLLKGIGASGVGLAISAAGIYNVVDAAAPAKEVSQHPWSGKSTHVLPATAETTWTGFFDNSVPPVLSVNSGAVLETQTLALYNDKLKPGLTLEEILKLRSDLAAEKKSSHTMTGPIFVNGAEPGDVLEIKIIKLIPRPYAVSYNLPGTLGKLGALPEDFPEGQVKDYELNIKKMTAKFNDNITIPLNPFIGIMAVAPAESGRVPTAPPREFGGNMDCKELIEGTTLYLPVFVKGALFNIGDAHAAQGDGEVNITALETALDKAVLQLTVRKDMQFNMPFAETPTHFISFGFHPSLDEAFKTALRQMIAFIVKEKGLTPLDAYALCSAAVDHRVTQVVDGNKGVHAMLPKSIFHK